MNLDLLLAQLVDVPGAHRGAAFVPATVLVLPDERGFVERGEVRGILIKERHGEGGSDYDPIFAPESYSRTSVELSPKEESAVSHWDEILRIPLPTIIKALKGK